MLSIPDYYAVHQQSRVHKTKSAVRKNAGATLLK
jgi:hypothetical protein